MALKTDYKDAMFDGARKYRIIQNPDGTSGISDETEYTQEGDKFGANDINATNTAINRLNHVTSVTLSASGWAGPAAPYSQTVNVEPILISMLADDADAATQKAYNKAFSIVSAGTGTTGDGTVTFKVYKKPATSIVVGLKGV